MKSDIKKLLIGGGIAILIPLLAVAVALCLRVGENSPFLLQCEEQVQKEWFELSKWSTYYRIANVIYGVAYLPCPPMVSCDWHVDKNFSCHKSRNADVYVVFWKTYATSPWDSPSRSDFRLVEKVGMVVRIGVYCIFWLVLLSILYYFWKWIYLKFVRETGSQNLWNIERLLCKRGLLFLLVLLWWLTCSFAFRYFQ